MPYPYGGKQRQVQVDIDTHKLQAYGLSASDIVAAVGAQNIHFAEEGAYTGETSVGQLLAVGATHTLIGHSERRQYFAETDEIVNKKLHTALKHHVIPIVCVGEVLAERELLTSARDISDGGIAVALAQAGFPKGIGATIEQDQSLMIHPLFGLFAELRRRFR